MFASTAGCAPDRAAPGRRNAPRRLASKQTRRGVGMRNIVGPPPGSTAPTPIAVARFPGGSAPAGRAAWYPPGVRTLPPLRPAARLAASLAAALAVGAAADAAAASPEAARPGAF